jgi:thiamine biosynthesis lipoprotein
VGLDPGGIGKGYAADLVVEGLLTAGAAGALVNLGGDLRVEGTPPSDNAWVLEIGEAAWAPEPLAVLELERGAVATSTPLRRRWNRAPATASGSMSETAHHLVDPDTGRSTENGPVVVTAIAGEGWWAEAVATAVAATPMTDWDSHLGHLDGANVAAVGEAAVAAVGGDGGLRLWGGFQHFMRTNAPRPGSGPRFDKENF